MAIVERHKSPNGLPDLIVDVDGEDWSIGFDGYPWHTHGDILDAYGYRGSPQEATRQFVDDILASRRPIVVWRIDGSIADFDVPVEREVDRRAIAEEIRKFRKYGPPGETAEICYWNGQRSSIE